MTPTTLIRGHDKAVILFCPAIADNFAARDLSLPGAIGNALRLASRAHGASLGQQDGVDQSGSLISRS